jgi:hypothetical protein
MKGIILALLLFGHPSFANMQAAKAAFWSDKNIQERINNQAYLVGEAQAIFLKESCEFLACVTDYLVGAPLFSLNSSPSLSILAKVRLIDTTVISVEVLPKYNFSIFVE